jgi:hypothetical protein
MRWPDATPLLHAVLVPISHRLLRYHTMHYELHPEADAPGGRGKE